ncbi:hypothetical protein NQ318_006947 [Aromia moschata]|uniref:Uncharacterized protein n=1 Tax=Aromia moschata TaxID=1265417 RepID=A0AAV8Y6Y7_9CUCU|nr:hypothetical protein NQ318_006947 [Aromia moschata]
MLYTCGLCEVIVDEIMDHPCIEGYGHIYIDNNHFSYLVLDDGKTTIRRSTVSTGRSGEVKGVVEDELETNENICPNKRQ